MMKEGIETNAVVMTMMTLSSTVFLRIAATAPSTMPTTAALKAAIRPSLAEVFMPSMMISMTWRPRCLSEGPKSNFVTMSRR